MPNALRTAIFLAPMHTTVFLDLQGIERQSELIFSILTKLFVIALVIIALLYIIRVLLDKSYSIRQVSVPPSFEQSGHSGPVIANRIHFRIQHIIQSVSAMEYAKGYMTGSTESDVSVDVAGLGMPVKAFIELVGKALGIYRGKRIDADFFIERNTVVMMLRITGQNPERLEAPMTDSVDTALKSLIVDAAEVILKYSNDEILQTYFGLIEQIGEKQIRLARYRYEKYKDNPNVEVNVIAAWAWGLCMLKRYDEAKATIEEGISRHKKAGRIYVIWGSMLYQQEKYQEAIEKFHRALVQKAAGETKARVSNIYSTMGNCYAMMLQLDEAMRFMDKAVATDGNSSRAYLGRAVVYLLRNEEEQFYESIEKALEKGLHVNQVKNHPSITSLLNDERMKRLIDKFSET